jgi:hypothetical protein
MPTFVVCLDNSDYEVSLEKRKLYEAIPDPEALQDDQLRLIDESGEDYLFPRRIFLELPLSDVVAEKVANIA